MACDSKHVLMFPRRRAGVEQGDGAEVRPRRGRQPVAIDLAAVRSKFALPQQQAAQQLGISLTSLKQACRKLGLTRWPYRRASRTLSHGALKPSGKEASPDQEGHRELSGQVAAQRLAPMQQRLAPLRPFTADLRCSQARGLCDNVLEAGRVWLPNASAAAPTILPSLHAVLSCWANTPIPSEGIGLHSTAPIPSEGIGAGLVGRSQEAAEGLGHLLAAAEAHSGRLDDLLESSPQARYSGARTIASAAAGGAQGSFLLSDVPQNSSPSSGETCSRTELICAATTAPQRGYSSGDLVQDNRQGCPCSSTMSISTRTALDSLLLLQQVSLLSSRKGDRFVGTRRWVLEEVMNGRQIFVICSWFFSLSSF